MKPHLYSPSIAHMGDCRVCGRTERMACHIGPNLPIKALSVRQPWAAAIIGGYKKIENRPRRTSVRGTVCIHAGLTTDTANFHRFRASNDVGWGVNVSELTTGAIIGIADIVDVVEQSDDPWFFGRYGYVLENARPISPIKVRGMLGFFDWRKQLAKDQEKTQ